jgi:secondary thiamine-phosphate synthase enzyme
MRGVGYPPVREIQVKTERRTQLVDITRDVQEAFGGDARGTAALVYVPHTTAGVTINEKIDPELLTDFEMALGEIVEDGWSWRHDDVDGPNAPAHLRASLVGPQVLVPLRDGALALGTYQGIFFCEFDGPRTRSVYVTTLS